MSEGKDLFADSKTYDRSMGRISRIAGETFLDWLSPPDGMRWLDIGCGTGSFSELILARHAPSTVTGIDPSERQIAFANVKPSAGFVDYRCGDAMALPFGDDAFDTAVMALVIQHIPDPAKAMAEINRVVRPNGVFAAYVWPAYAEGHPYQPLAEAIRSLGGVAAGRPGTRIRTIEGLAELFAASGLTDVEACSLELALAFEDFDDYWSAQQPDLYRDMSATDIGRLQGLLRERLPTDGSGRIAYTARFNAISGRVSG